MCMFSIVVSLHVADAPLNFFFTGGYASEG